MVCHWEGWIFVAATASYPSPAHSPAPAFPSALRSSFNPLFLKSPPFLSPLQHPYPFLQALNPVYHLALSSCSLSSLGPGMSPILLIAASPRAWHIIVQSPSHVQLLATPWTAAYQGFPVLHRLQDFAQVLAPNRCWHILAEDSGAAAGNQSEERAAAGKVGKHRPTPAVGSGTGRCVTKH